MGLEIMFLVVGYSFLPPDRVFAKIEKEINSREIKKSSIPITTSCSAYNHSNGIPENWLGIRYSLKKSIGDHEIGFMTSVIDKLNAISNRASQVATNKDDSYDHFGKYIASMLRSIGPPTAIRLQQNFMNEITNAMCPPEYVTDNSTAGRSSGRQSNLSTFSASNDDDYITLFTDL
ncbi:unnamed protein product [Pieris macdunnoughi]|uniref:Uncharacterized protein n=1 Tax=Pieris macdunnoughi TaxID=345717 RepID=A0A821UFQ1_9NEOP|nr:unnamed protein product [Pieris macdunnoughi]